MKKSRWSAMSVSLLVGTVGRWMPMLRNCCPRLSPCRLIQDLPGNLERPRRRFSLPEISTNNSDIKHAEWYSISTCSHCNKNRNLPLLLQTWCTYNKFFLIHVLITEIQQAQFNSPSSLSNKTHPIKSKSWNHPYWLVHIQSSHISPLPNKIKQSSCHSYRNYTIE